MPVLTLCPVPGCARLTPGGRCSRHRLKDQDRRQQKDRAQGRTTARWKRLREQVKARDGHQCRRCGTTEDLTVHLDPALNGNHNIATLADCLTLCRSCHGSVDAPRARANTNDARRARSLNGGAVNAQGAPRERPAPTPRVNRPASDELDFRCGAEA